MEHLDYYLSTQDEHFNANAQFWYFEFTGTNKPITEKPFEIFIKAWYEMYFFILENLNKPFTCVEKIKTVANSANFNEVEKIVFVDRILGILINHPNPDSLTSVFIQIVDFRHDLSPYEIEAPNWYFDFEKIKRKLNKISQPIEKHKYLMGLLFDLKSKANELDEIEQLYYADIGIVNWIAVELKRAEYERKVEEILRQEQNTIEQPPPQPKAKPQVKLSKRTGAKTDLIRVLNALYELKFFINHNEQEPLTKKDFMKQIGQFFGADLSNYYASLSQARKEQPLETNLKIFEDMKALTQTEHYTSEVKRTKNK